MSTSIDFMEYVCEQLQGIGELRYRKLFGEYMLYVNEKPILTICNSIVYVKKLDGISHLMENACCGYPYKGAKPHYILDIDNKELSRNVVTLLETLVSIPVKKRRKEE